jgi:hypothetical protein
MGMEPVEVIVMKKTVLIGIVVYLAFCVVVVAQEQVPEVSQTGSREAVLIYEPDFFAASSPATAQDMVNRLPGFSINNGDEVRGFAGAGGNVLINGSRPASKTDSVTSVLARIQKSRVSHIELIRGGAPGIDMQGHSVVVNVVLNNETSRQHAVTVQGFLFEGGPYLPGGRYDFSTTEGERTWGVTIARNVSMSDSTGHGAQIRRDSDGSIVSREQVENKFDGGGWTARTNWAAPFLAGLVELTGGISQNDYSDWLVYTATGSERRFDYEHDNRNADVGLRTEQALSPRLNLELRLIQNLGKRDMINTALSPSGSQLFNAESETGESILRSVFRWQKSDTLRVESGGELAYNFLDTEQRFTVNGDMVPLPQSTTRVSELRGEIFSMLIWQAGDNLSIEAGGRLEQSTIRQSGDGAAERSFFYPKPRLAATWNLAESHQMRLRLERELGQLNFSDFAASSSLANDEVLGGNLDLKPQQRWISELVYEHRFTERGMVSFTLRHDEISDVVDVMPIQGGMTAVGNIGDGTLDRAEVNLRMPLDGIGLQDARLMLKAQYDHTRVTDPATGKRRQISGVRPFTSTIQIEQDVQRLNLTWGVEYTPHFRDTNFNPDQRRTMELNNFWVAYAEHTISSGLTARLQVTVWDDFRIKRENWSDRSLQTLAFSEDLRIDPRDFVRFTVRKAF